METSLIFLSEVKSRVIVWPCKSTLRYIPKRIREPMSTQNLVSECLYKNIFHNSQKVKRTENLHQRMNEWINTLWYIYKSNKKEWSANTVYSINKLWCHYAKWKKPAIKMILYVHLYENLEGKFIDTEIDRDGMLFKVSKENWGNKGI